MNSFLTTSISLAASQEHDTLGVSVYHLEHVFLAQEVCTAVDVNGNPLSRSSRIYEIEDLEGPSSVIRNKGVNTICPLDRKIGAAYVHCLEGDIHVGKATHMLSYSWAYTIGDIVETLNDYCHTQKLDPNKTYIWICCLCVNQHRVVAQSAQHKSGVLLDEHIDFLSIFGEQVKKIGHVLAMMAPWKSPIYLTRIWCVYELFIAHTNGCHLDIVIPPVEKSSFKQDIIVEGGGVDSLYEVLGKTHVEHAQASVEKDRLKILKRVESSVGHQTLNNQVNTLLRSWMESVLLQLVETEENSNVLSYTQFCNTVGAVLNSNGRNDAALKILSTAMVSCESVIGSTQDPSAAIEMVLHTTYNNIGEVLCRKGEYNGACDMYKKALAIQEPVLGDHPDTATTYNNIGDVYYQKGDYKGAIEMFKKALLIQEDVLGAHPKTATTYIHIGASWQVKGDFNGAIEMYKKALAIRERLLGAHPATANTFNKIGDVLCQKGDYNGAIDMYQKALAIQEPVLGPHADTSNTYNNIGDVLWEKGDYNGAREMYQKALAIQEPLLGAHPATATTYRNIGAVLFVDGDFNGSHEMYQKALAIQEPALGAHLSTANTYISIGLVLFVMNNYIGAIEMYQKALAIKEPVLGTHPATATTYNNIGEVLCRKGDYSGAIEMYKKALSIQEPVLGAHPDTANTYRNIGELLWENADYNGAIEMYQKALAIQESVLGAHILTANTYRDIGQVLWAKGDYNGSIDMLKKALAFEDPIVGAVQITVNTYINSKTQGRLQWCH